MYIDSLKITFLTALFMFSFCEMPTVKVTRYFGLKGRSCEFKYPCQQKKNAHVTKLVGELTKTLRLK